MYVDKIERQCAHAEPPARPPDAKKGPHSTTNERICAHRAPPHAATRRAAACVKKLKKKSCTICNFKLDFKQSMFDAARRSRLAIICAHQKVVQPTNDNSEKMAGKLWVAT